MSYQVVLPSFEGPLDLLLHLIDTNELDIYNIPISFITSQYIDYMKAAKEINLNLSSDFVLMAGTLLTIKARFLLPKRPVELNEEDNTDPRDELIEKLLEYRIYKENAAKLKEIAEGQARIYYRDIDEKQLIGLFPKPNPLGNLDPADLACAFNQILKSMVNRHKTIELPKDEITLQEQTLFILNKLKEQPAGIAFEALLSGDTVIYLITTFMALLELLHRSKIWVKQKTIYGDIYVFLAEE